MSTFPLSEEIVARAEQVRAISDLESKFTPERLRHNSFEWVSRGQNGGEWLPKFDAFWKPSAHGAPSLEDIWRENEEGIDRRFSIKELTEHWGARWKRNTNGIKVESVRRGKIVSLIRRLASQEGWSIEKAFRFLNARYHIPDKSVPHLKNLRAFTNYLGEKNNAGMDEVMRSAVLFTDSAT